jgi:hypothetical protein
MLIEGGLTAIAVAMAFAWPRLGCAGFSRIERCLGRFARKQGLAVVVVGLSAFLLRLAILPFCPIPLPFVPADFSFLLAADTFAHCRLANPTPAMWVHFESIHITMQPTYVSMYFPAQGLVLAASKVLLGNPWYGVLLTSALMCATLCWMLQAWMPASWALLGGLLAIIHLGLFSYWINTYHAAGFLGAFGGALILGALPRFLRTPRLCYTMAMAAGVTILGITRPYECLLLCLPVLVVLGRWLIVGKNRPSARGLFRLIAAPLLLVIAGAAWMGYYDYKAFGSPMVLPYTVNRSTYAMAPYYVWQKPKPEPLYHHAAMRSFYYIEMEGVKLCRTVPDFINGSMKKVAGVILFLAGFAFLPLAFMLRRVLLDHRVRFLVVCVLILMGGMIIEIFLIPHYIAPFTAAFYAIGLQAMRHFRVWRPCGKPAGKTLVRLMVTICLIMAGLRLYAGPLHFPLPEWPASNWNFSWYGPDHFGTERLRVETELEQLPGKQLAIVRYTSKHNPFDEWVYNGANIDGSKVIWAREMDSANNLQLIRYYKDRKVWLVQMDTQPVTFSSYPTVDQISSATH